MSYVLKFNNETKFLASATFEQLFRFLFMLLRKIDGREVLCKLYGRHVEWIMKFPDTLLMQLFGKIPLLTKSCVDIKRICRCRVLILVPLIRHTIVMLCRLNELKNHRTNLTFSTLLCNKTDKNEIKLAFVSLNCEQDLREKEPTKFP